MLLTRRGYPLRLLVRPESRHHHRIEPGAQVVNVSLNQDSSGTDLTDDVLLDALRNSSAVVYCAGTVRGRAPADFEAANINGVRAVLAAMSRLDTPPPPFLLISSLAASRPELSSYANSKYLGERVLDEFPEMPWSIIRPPAVYGPGEKELLPLFKLVRRGLLPRTGPVDQRFSLLHVDDLAVAVATWLDHTQACHQQNYAIDDGTIGGYDWPRVAQVASNKRVTILPIPRMILNLAASSNWLFSGLMGYAPMLTAGKVRELTQASWLGDNADFHAATGWQPAIDLEHGLKTLFEHAQS